MRDRHFASLLGPTFRNRSYLLAATSFGHLTTDDTFPPPGSTGYKPITGTIFDLLDKNNITWADYYQDAPQGASFRTFVTTGPGNNDPNFLPLTTFFAQAAAGALPSVSFVDPNFGLTGTTPENDEHPPTEHPAAPPNHLTHRDEYAHPLEDMFDFAAAPSLNTVLRKPCRQQSTVPRRKPPLVRPSPNHLSDSWQARALASGVCRSKSVVPIF